jgi:purine-cytosine permease-like protein
MRHVAANNFWLYSLTTLVPIFFAFVLLTLCHGLLLNFLQQYAAFLALTESKIPVKFVFMLTQNFVTKYAHLEMPHKQEQ